MAQHEQSQNPNGGLLPPGIDGSQPFEMTAVLPSVPGTEDQLEAVLTGIARDTVANEPGALIFQPYRAVQHPEGGVDFIVRERWENEAAFLKHQQSDYHTVSLAKAAEQGLLSGGFKVWFVTPVSEGRPEAIKKPGA